MCYQFVYKNGPRYNRIIFVFHKVIDIIHVSLVLKPWMQYLPFVRMWVSVNQSIVPFEISILQDHYHQIFSYRSLECSSSLVVWTKFDVPTKIYHNFPKTCWFYDLFSQEICIVWHVSNSSNIYLKLIPEVVLYVS